MSTTSIQRLSAALAAVPLILPMMPDPVQANDQTPKQNSVATRPLTDFRPADIKLQPGNFLVGQVRDAHGAIVPNADILVTQAHREIARATANESGEFSVFVPKGGVYLVTSGDSLQLVRAWTAAAAPPNSRDQLLLVPPTIVVRGQNPGSSLLGMSSGTATVVGLAVAAGVATAIAVPLALNSNNKKSNNDTPPDNQAELRPATP